MGGELNLNSGSVSDDVVLAGGRIEIARNFPIGGSAVITGGKVTLDGEIGDSATVRAGDLHLNGEIKGDADLAGRRIVIGPTARIGGDLTYRARNIEISPLAVIAGKTTALPFPQLNKRQIFGLVVGGLIFAAIIYFLGTAVLTLAITAFAPALMAATAMRIRTNPLATLGWGLLWVVAVPVLAAFLCATIIGIPLGLVLIGLYVLAFPFGGATAVHFLGMTIRGWFGRKAEPGLGARLGWTLLGAAALCVLVLIPFVGGVVCILAGVVGLGALTAELGRAVHRAPDSPAAA
jgi:cytoskeletal protein CcmA (bactofilin family)